MKVAVILLNFGGAENPGEAFPYLYRLFNDPTIMPLPAPFRQVLAFFFAALRTGKTKRLYARMGCSSPLRRQTEAQARALEESLDTARDEYRCFVAMRYGAPSLPSVADAVKKWRADDIVFLPLYPQYSTVSTGSGWRELTKALGKEAAKPVFSYPDEPGFIGALAGLTKRAYETADKHGKPRVLFSAHGLPERIVRRGDPYPEHCARTMRALVDALAVPGLDGTLCFQSRVGPLRWTGPSTEDEIEKAARANRPVLVVPISFVAESSETTVELDRDGEALAMRLGAPCFVRVPTVGTTLAFIEGLARTVRAARGQAPEDKG